MHTNVLRSRALRLKWHVAALRFEIAMLRHARVLRHARLLRKAGFRPDQARDERGGQRMRRPASETGCPLAADTECL